MLLQMTEFPFFSWLNSILLHMHIYTPHLYPFIHWRTLRLFSCLGYCEQCYNNMGVVQVSSLPAFISFCYIPRIGFAGSYIWQLYFKFFEELPYCSPQRLKQFAFPPTVYKDSLFSTSGSTFVISYLVDDHTQRCEPTSHCDTWYRYHWVFLLIFFLPVAYCCSAAPEYTILFHYPMLLHRMLFLALMLFLLFRIKSYLSSNVDLHLLNCPYRLQFSSLPFLAHSSVTAGAYILAYMEQSYLASFILMQLLIASPSTLSSMPLGVIMVWPTPSFVIYFVYVLPKRALVIYFERECDVWRQVLLLFVNM